MTDDTSLSLADIIARTPGAQPREKALASIKARRARFLAQPPAATGGERDIAAPEPVPMVEEPDDYATGFWKRFANKNEANNRLPARGKKPRLVVDNDDPPKSPNKR
jgi:hypothetical protein